MFKTVLRQQLVPLVILAILALIELSTLLVHHHTKQTYRVPLRLLYERVMHRIDDAVTSISATMAREGLAVDFEEILQQAAAGDMKSAFEEAPEAPQQKDYVLTGVMWNPRRPLAFLNDNLVGVGEIVGQAEVIKIAKDAIQVRMDDGTERTLSLEEAGVR